MKVEFAQLAGRDNGTAYNLERALAAIAACAGDTQLIVFPETHLMGFPSAETVADIAEPLDGPTVQAVIQAARERNIAVVIGMAENDNGQFYNTTLLITPEGIALRYRKTHLWASDRGVFTPGDRYATCVWNGVRIGLLICYDIEFPETARANAQLGAELLIVTNGNMDPYGPTHRNHGPRPGKPGVCADGQPGRRGRWRPVIRRRQRVGGPDRHLAVRGRARGRAIHGRAGP